MEELIDFTLHNPDIPAYLVLLMMAEWKNFFFIREEELKHFENKASAFLVASIEGLIVFTLITILLGIICSFFKGYVLLYLVELPLAMMAICIIHFFSYREFRYSDLSKAGIRSFMEFRYGRFFRNKMK